MKITMMACFFVILTSLAWSQAETPDMPAKGTVIGGAAVGPRGMMAGDGPVIIRHEMGEWWKNSETAKKLQLSDAQIAQLNQIFYNHRLKLIDDGAGMEKEDLKLQTLLDADVPNEGQIESQVDQVLGARGKLEREYTMMNLDLRKVLSVAQWRQLKSIRDVHGAGGNQFFFYRKMGPDAEPLPPMPPPGPPNPGSEMF